MKSSELTLDMTKKTTSNFDETVLNSMLFECYQLLNIEEKNSLVAVVTNGAFHKVILLRQQLLEQHLANLMEKDDVELAKQYKFTRMEICLMQDIRQFMQLALQDIAENINPSVVMGMTDINDETIQDHS